MKVIITLILSTLMLNLSAHAGTKKKKNPEVWKKQKMEEKKYHPSFEKNPRPYSPRSLPEERIQTGGQ